MREYLPSRLLAAAALGALLGQAPALAQIAPARTLDELKAETQSRADRNAYPVVGLKPDDVREALGRIHSLDRDEWAAAWGSIAERYAAGIGVDTPLLGFSMTKSVVNALIGVLTQQGPVYTTDASATGAVTSYTGTEEQAPASGIPAP